MTPKQAIRPAGTPIARNVLPYLPPSYTVAALRNRRHPGWIVVASAPSNYEEPTVAPSLRGWWRPSPKAKRCIGEEAEGAHVRDTTGITSLPFRCLVLVYFCLWEDGLNYATRSDNRLAVYRRVPRLTTA